MIVSELDKQIIRVLQEDLPLCPQPFKEIAQSLDIAEQELIEKISFYIDNGIIRRFGAMIRHRQIGFKSNAMIVWQVEPAKTEETGKLMAHFPQVSHCYQRPTHSNWPYNMFTMVHGESPEQCYDIADKISKAAGISNYKLLFSTKELKKTSMKYFCS